MLIAMLFCIAAQVVTFYPFYIAWQQDLKQYGNDLGVTLRKRFYVWLLMFPAWAIPIAVMIGEIL